MTCNDWTLSWDTATYKYTNCVKWVINNCAANASFSFSWHTYSINALNHWSTQTNILSTTIAVPASNWTFKYTLSNIECNDWGYINASENAAPVVQSCDSGYGISWNSCILIWSIASNPWTNCATIKSAMTSSASWTYWIKPGATAIQAYCDMSTNWGGWTRVWTNISHTLLTTTNTTITSIPWSTQSLIKYISWTATNGWTAWTWDWVFPQRLCMKEWTTWYYANYNW
jgi:hypothetical protein